MKKIDVILKDKCSLISGLFQRKSARILRNVEQAIAFAEDKVDAFKEKKEEVLKSLAGVADADHTSECSDVINSYIDTVREIRQWQEAVEILNDLKAELLEEVELEPEEK